MKTYWAAFIDDLRDWKIMRNRFPDDVSAYDIREVSLYVLCELFYDYLDRAGMIKGSGNNSEPKQLVEKAWKDVV